MYQSIPEKTKFEFLAKGNASKPNIRFQPIEKATILRIQGTE